MIENIITEYRPEHYRTERQQSRALQSAEWESRVKPLTSGLQQILHWFGVIGFFAVVGAMCFWR